MGQTSYIYEAGCAFAIDGETTLLTGDLVPDENGTIYEQIEQRGIPKMLFEHFEGRLEYHAPWHTAASSPTSSAARSTSRRRTGCSRERRRTTTCGCSTTARSAARCRRSRARPTPTTWSRSMVSKANAVAAHARARGYDPADCIAVGDSVEDLEVAAAVGRFFVVANGPERDPGLRAALGRLGQRDRDRGGDGRRLLRGGRLDPG